MSALFQGWLGEKLTTLGLWLKLDEQVYRRIDNVILPTSNGTTQIDHVLVSVYGVFVIETKNMKGWIFGAKDSPQWTQVIFGQKRQFQNPLRQNYRHTKCLSEFLDIDHGLIHSIVFFIGECEFKTEMPENVRREGLSSYIRRFSKPIIDPGKVTHIESQLRNTKNNPNLTGRIHLQSLQARHDPTNQALQRQCPRCGGQLVERTAKRGEHAGKQFLGCSKYPACKFILQQGAVTAKPKPLSFWDVLFGQ